jgi:CDP-6-deoxy-D-xylo-4-hexulose-3-dehydrase
MDDIYTLASSTWGPEERAAIEGVIGRNRFTMGDSVRTFETNFAAKFGMRYALMVNSGSSANLVGIAALTHRKDRPLRPGDEVIVPAISWATTYYPLQQYGLKLVFVDVDLETLNLDVTLLENALSPRTRMVIAASILGNPARLDVIRAFCDAHGLILFEDNCESMGARLGGRYTGTYGHINTFSSFFSHHISTMEGGIILTDDFELYQLCLSLRAHGWTRDLPENQTLYERSPEDFYEAYRFILPGFNVRPLEIAGAVGVEQLKKLDHFIEIRRKNGNLFTELFRDDDRFIIQKENGESSWFAFTIILHPARNLDRKAVMRELERARIEFRIITGGNFLRHDVIRYFDHRVAGGRVPHADTAHDSGFFVGNHPCDLTSQLHRLRDVLDAQR